MSLKRRHPLVLGCDRHSVVGSLSMWQRPGCSQLSTDSINLEVSYILFCGVKTCMCYCKSVTACLHSTEHCNEQWKSAGPRGKEPAARIWISLACLVHLLFLHWVHSYYKPLNVHLEKYGERLHRVLKQLPSFVPTLLTPMVCASGGQQTAQDWSSYF